MIEAGTSNMRTRLTRIEIGILAAISLLGGCSQERSTQKQEELPQPSVSGPAVSKDTPRETQSIQRILGDIATDPAYLTNPYMMRPERVMTLESELQRLGNANDSASKNFEYASSLLNIGQSQRAIEQFELLKERMAASPESSLVGNQSLVDLSIATGHLRIAEEMNCLENHSPDSCIFPIRGGGIHHHKTGGLKAKQTLTDFLKRNPENTDAIWLYNIVAMILGEYPHEVPKPWLLDPALFESEADIGRFPDIAGSLGIDVNGLAGGCVVDDFDNDYDLDLMVTSWDIDDPIRVFLNQANGTFKDQSRDAGLDGITGGLNMIQADYNNDGFVDIFVMRGAWLGNEGEHPNSLLHNNGDGTWKDVTIEAGLLSFHPTQTATWFDYNLDGHLDLFIGNEYWIGQVHPSELFHNNGDGTFTEKAAELGLSVRKFVKGVTSSDYDNDGWPDLYLSCLGNRNFLFHNNGTNHVSKGKPRHFSEVGRASGVSEPKDSFPTWFFDYDNDGFSDLFVIGYKLASVGDFVRDYRREAHDATLPKLYRNLGNGKFKDVTTEARLNRILLGMGVNYGDLDNDGFPDFYVSTGNPELMTLTPNRMFKNNGGKHFQDITSSGGFGHLQKGHGVAFADLDQDGNQDVYTVLGGAVSGDVYRNALFQNPGNNHHWIKLRLEGTQSNRSAIGSKVKIITQTGGKSSHYFSEVSSGGSFGANPLLMEIGLGNAESIESLEIRWPGNKTAQILSNIKLDSYYHIIEGDTAPKNIPCAPFILKRNPSTSHHH